MKKALIIILSFVEFLDDTRGIISSILSANSRIGRLRPAFKCLHSANHGREIVVSSSPGLTSILGNITGSSSLVIHNSLAKEKLFRENDRESKDMESSCEFGEDIRRNLLLQSYKQALEEDSRIVMFPVSVGWMHCSGGPFVRW